MRMCTSKELCLSMATSLRQQAVARSCTVCTTLSCLQHVQIAVQMLSRWMWHICSVVY